MRYVHVIPNTAFVEAYIKLINKKLNFKEHLFIIVGKGFIHKNDFSNVILIDKITKATYFISLIRKIQRCEKIIFHGLFNKNLIIASYFTIISPNSLKKSYWGIWGGDLYRYKERKNNILNCILEIIRKRIIKNISGLITQVRGDYELAQEWYNTKGKFHYCFMYPSNLFKEYDIEKSESTNPKVVIQIGNSAAPSNNHIEIFEKLQKHKNENIEIVCPLSYGNSTYRQAVIVKGKEIFGHKFKPLTEFMPFDDYLQLLSKIDIAIFNHKRQQAMGNITTLLGLGKKVYIREEITTWHFCIDHDLKVYSANGDYDDLFEEMDEDIKQKNVENVKTKFSEKKLVEDLMNIFE
ncbi:TDP-N-acetylfucosamine:lipid II N-acetylfucosaminyltransferase [Anoxynatronum sibiricum]|uniref:TDP-N-acetylfucosamine:lipid II N-acetylfucosaminyltransferase n=1 Tax=Anoxynatronum sibiricum TaxID=210623 RepID=A0ABU9VXZ2_9CLOT